MSKKKRKKAFPGKTYYFKKKYFSENVQLCMDLKDIEKLSLNSIFKNL